MICNHLVFAISEKFGLVYESILGSACCFGVVLLYQVTAFA